MSDQQSYGKSKEDILLKKHVGMIHCENRLSLLQRKICNILLFNALDRIEGEEIHELSIRKLCSLIEYRSNDLDLIKKSIKTLISTVMEWNLLSDVKFLKDDSYSKDSLSWNASSLLAGATIEGGVVRYSYSPQIRSVLSSLDIYGRINLFVQSRFNSSYSLALYENCVRFLRVKRTSWLTLELFRSLMGLSKSQYPQFKELKRNVISVAIKEINLKSDIYVEAEFRKSGRQIAAIRFHILENENYKPKFKKKSVNSENTTPINSVSLKDNLVLNFGLSTKQADQIINNYSENYILEKINLVQNKKAKNKAAYIISAIRDDYKNSEKAQDQRPPSKKYLEYTREPIEESKSRSLNTEYTKYKFNRYLQHFEKHEQQNKVIDEFISFEKKNNNIMGAIYKKKGINTIPAMICFMAYVDQKYQSHGIRIKSFDDFIADEDIGELESV